jgi:hypothetical protein
VSWTWVVLVLLVGYGLGITGLLAWREYRKPYRRAFHRLPDRRRVDRRRGQVRTPVADRRSGDRRIGERRRGRPAWAGATVLVSALVLALVAA